MEKDALDMTASQLLHDLRRKNPTGKSTPKDCIELLIQPAHPHLGEVPVRVDDGLPFHLALPLPGQLQLAALRLVEHHRRVGDEHTRTQAVLHNLAFFHLEIFTPVPIH